MQTQRTEVLEMALVGLAKIQSEIQQELHQLRGGATGAPASGKKRHMSRAARARIAAAQKKRWAAYHQERANG